ncbi:MAG: LPS export ABC transporter permease LptG [Betaproteobacteria bacterium SG8_40]|nr:MAG: LPS export ABC transporter permease LptG [Betaproteobacteria bacterium SG8_40]
MRMLRRYVARQVFAATALVFAALLFLFGFFDFIQELSDVGRGGYGLPLAALYVALSLPGRAYEILPVAALIGTLFALSQLVINSEYTVMRVSGMSMRNMAVSLTRIGVALSVITFLLGEVVAPLTEQAAQSLRFKATTSSNVVAQAFRSGLWVKDANKFVNVSRIMPETVIHDVHVYEFDDRFRLHTISHASRGEYQRDDLWVLHDVVQTRFEGTTTSVNEIAQWEWHSVLKPSILNVLMVVPEQMSVWDLYAYLEHLRANNQETVRYEIAMWQKIIYPFAVLVMMVLALPFANFQARSGGIGARIFTGIMLGLGFHLANRLFGHLGLLNAWPPLFSALTPMLGFLAAAIWMMRKVEKR